MSKENILTAIQAVQKELYPKGKIISDTPFMDIVEGVISSYLNGIEAQQFRALASQFAEDEIPWQFAPAAMNHFGLTNV